MYYLYNIILNVIMSSLNDLLIEHDKMD